MNERILSFTRDDPDAPAEVAEPGLAASVEFGGQCFGGETEVGEVAGKLLIGRVL
jgi:hypothetical protein